MAKENNQVGDELITKITTKTIGLTKTKLQELALANKNKSVPVARVYGHLSGATAEQSDLGPYVSFTGNFKAVNLLTGQSFRAGRMLLPGVAESALSGSFESSKADGKVLVFGLDLTVKFQEGAATSYVFGAVPVIQNQDDPITAMEKLLPAK